MFDSVISFSSVTTENERNEQMLSRQIKNTFHTFLTEIQKKRHVITIKIKN